MVHDITEMLAAKDEARLYADVARNIPLGLSILRLEDPDDPASLRYIGANPAAAHLSGNDQADLVGKLIYEALPHLKDTDRAERYAQVVREQRVIDFGEVH